MDTRKSGQAAFFFGDLMSLRQELGLSKAALAEILGVALTTLYRWEGPGLLSTLNDRNAEAVDSFVRTARETLAEYPNFAEDFCTTAKVSRILAITHEMVMDRIRNGDIPAWDFGILGIFVANPDVYSVNRQRIFFG